MYAFIYENLSEEYKELLVNISSSVFAQTRFPIKF